MKGEAAFGKGGCIGVRIALFGDIHGNLTALSAVVEELDALGVERRICLGDLAFRGPEPQEVIAAVASMELEAVVVGNTDQWLFQGFPDGFSPGEERLKQLQAYRSWCLERLDAGALEWLRGLPAKYSATLGEHTLCVVHSSPLSTEDWYPSSLSDEELEGIFRGAPPCDILVYGHIHTPFVRRLYRRWLLNAGSVGHPVDGDARASYLLLEAARGSLNLSVRRVAYDAAKAARIAAERELPFAELYGEAIRTGQGF